ncbi:MAG: GNAT family N-acetyltransferase [Pseudomonadota bacterium]
MSRPELAAFPKSAALPDGTSVELRVMSRDDKDAMLAFARHLSPEDLMFLRVDITQGPVLDSWISDIEAGFKTALVAYDASGLIGYASVTRNPLSWTRHVGEIRINVSPAYRSRGLGRLLTSSIFDVAAGMNLKKLTAHMTSDQTGAQSAFRRLGFVPEALLGDYVQDRNGITRDMVIMSFDVDGHSDQAAGTLKL